MKSSQENIEEPNTLFILTVLNETVNALTPSLIERFYISLYLRTFNDHSESVKYSLDRNGVPQYSVDGFNYFIKTYSTPFANVVDLFEGYGLKKSIYILEISDFYESLAMFQNICKACNIPGFIGYKKILESPKFPAYSLRLPDLEDDPHPLLIQNGNKVLVLRSYS